MKRYTIRNIPDYQYTLIRIEAARQGISINEFLLKLIEKETKTIKK